MDFNGDGKPDLATPNLNSDNVSVLLNTTGAAADADGDGVPDSSDNCPNVSNSGQTDGDGIGDACDTPDDTTPPQLDLPADIITEQAEGQNGAAVSWPDVTATDDVDGPVQVSCDKTSGDIFPLGTTTVTCSATDAAGNTARGSFDVTVVAATDTTAPPTVFSTNPGDNLTMPNRANNVMATFSEDVQNVNANTFKLEQVIVRKGVEKTSPVAATVTPASGTVAQGATATLNPKKDLQKGSTYRATLTSGVTDMAGNALATTSWTFKVASR